METQQFDLAAFKVKRDTAQKKGQRWEATVFEIKQAYAEGELNLRSANLRSANLRSADLYGADLRSADLEGADLEGANLRSADLYGADLRSANLRSADLRSANLRSADLYGADLRSAKLRSAKLEGANLRSADLYGADLRSAKLRSADLEGANLENANLEGANLEGANGIYSAYAPNLSSRGAALTGGVVINGGKVQLRFWAGCKERITAEKLLEYVQKTHEDNIHAKQYRAAIQFIQACFDVDTEVGKWDYLLELEANKGK